jgi:hypothetical protein
MHLLPSNRHQMYHNEAEPGGYAVCEHWKARNMMPKGVRLDPGTSPAGTQMMNAAEMLTPSLYTAVNR